jgi:hypothetical protein
MPPNPKNVALLLALSLADVAQGEAWSWWGFVASEVELGKQVAE